MNLYIINIVNQFIWQLKGLYCLLTQTSNVSSNKHATDMFQAGGMFGDVRHPAQYLSSLFEFLFKSFTIGVIELMYIKADIFCVKSVSASRQCLIQTRVFIHVSTLINDRKLWASLGQDHIYLASISSFPFNILFKQRTVWLQIPCELNMSSSSMELSESHEDTTPPLSTIFCIK